MWSLCVVLVSVTTQILASSLGHTSQAEHDKIIYDLNDAEKLFQEFLQTYEKTVEGEEYNTRLEVFKNNLQKINKLNEEQNSASFGITQFADMTEEEIPLYTDISNTQRTRNCIDVNIGYYGIPPDHMDFRDKHCVTPVKNQGHCRASYLFSTVGAVESAYALSTGVLTRFSEQQVLDCASGIDGCSGGLIEPVYKYLVYNGLQPESDYFPYQAEVQPCKYNASKILTKPEGCYTVKLIREHYLPGILAFGTPFSVGLSVGPEFASYKSGVIKNCPARLANHFALLIGYGTDDDGTKYWILKNSWGEQWGEQGYFRLERNRNACGITDMIILGF